MAAAMIDLIAVLGLLVTTLRKQTMTDPRHATEGFKRLRLLLPRPWRGPRWGAFSGPLPRTLLAAGIEVKPMRFAGKTLKFLTFLALIMDLVISYGRTMRSAPPDFP